MHQPPPCAEYNAPRINVNGAQLKNVETFDYLESTLSRNMRIDEEVAQRISKASQAFGRLQASVWNCHVRGIRAWCGGTPRGGSGHALHLRPFPSRVTLTLSGHRAQVREEERERRRVAKAQPKSVYAVPLKRPRSRLRPQSRPYQRPGALPSAGKLAVSQRTTLFVRIHMAPRCQRAGRLAP
ncbi:unnamed protein product [Schistocephalus solidus]|uniref:Uncharacterized protein n=1 Tax=Schistocephalus solidus TaxID=70667 RepID=A0A183SW17_SCHSO|nr:unnamed protein product [Schistocephalus solidus]